LVDVRRERDALLSMVRQQEKKREKKHQKHTQEGGTSGGGAQSIINQTRVPDPATDQTAAAGGLDSKGPDSRGSTKGGTNGGEKQNIREQLDAFSDGDY
jgi:hypothetical protein